ncbi:antifungal protein precursor [Aspergillus caelatus]|uniref:Antifungal protein n=1 Tax=Aspergillus caelatus TaxID=61420 RepID=A0A5N7A5Z4_9EURO|nr:antifungal protein precursor [Aspergillus caelatus]KAE8365135.1 antifungal protein precursor [Aspergillus caelatus]
MHLTTVVLFLFAAMGAVATPIESEAFGLDARAEASTLIKYPGQCTKAKNECKYKSQNKKNTFVKCPSFANKRCTKDGNWCQFDSYSRNVECK